MSDKGNYNMIQDSSENGKDGRDDEPVMDGIFGGVSKCGGSGV